MCVYMFFSISCYATSLTGNDVLKLKEGEIKRERHRGVKKNPLFEIKPSTQRHRRGRDSVMDGCQDSSAVIERIEGARERHIERIAAQFGAAHPIITFCVRGASAIDNVIHRKAVVSRGIRIQPRTPPSIRKN